MRTSSFGQKNACATSLHSPHYFGAVHYRQAFHIDPYNYALGLAALAEKAGARIFEETPAVSLDPAGVRKRVVTPAGRVRAAHVVLAGNIHLGALVPQLAATLLPVTTFVMVTEPIGEILHEVVRYRGAISDTNRADNHYRIVGGDRLQWSGRMRSWDANPALDRARASPMTSGGPFPTSGKSASRICGVGRLAVRSIACRRSAKLSAGCGWQAALAGMALTTRRLRANSLRAALSRVIKHGACLRPTNWYGQAACSVVFWRKAFIGARGR